MTVDFRFSITAAEFRLRIEELAAAAGVAADDYAARASLDDLYLATACAAGDPAAWAECESKHFGFIRAFAQRFLPDAGARDLSDEIIADLWQRRKIERYAGRSTLRTWLGAVVAHAAMNVRRAAEPVVPLSPATAATSPATTLRAPSEDASSERVLAGLVVEALGTLAQDEKLLLHLYYEQGLTLDQMEIATRRSKATLSRRLTHIRAKLLEAVDELAGRMGTSARTVRDGLRLERLEIDLSTLLRPVLSLEEKGPKRV